jgi:general L-amino acid transport system permease protein
VGQPPGDVLFHFSGALHAKSNRRTKAEAQLQRSKVRAWLFQIITIVAVVSLGWYLFDNTQTNLQHRGIPRVSTFERSAGFGIAQHLIDYTESDSYARVFVIGLLNTLLVTVHRRDPGDAARFHHRRGALSPNWMINKLATVYVEVFRNIPPLLQILFWYFAVFLTMPGPRNSHNFGDTFFVSSRGLNMPAAHAADGFWPFVASVVVAIVAIVLMARWANKRFGDRCAFHKFWAGLALFIVIPALCALIFGAPLHWEMPKLQGLQLRRWLGADPGTAGADPGPDGVHRSVHRRDRALGHQVGQPRPDRSGAFARPAPGPTLRKVIIPQACG